MGIAASSQTAEPPNPQQNAHYGAVERDGDDAEVAPHVSQPELRIVASDGLITAIAIGSNLHVFDTHVPGAPQLLEMKRLDGHTDQVWCVDFSCDGKLLVSASADFTLRLWSTATGEKIGEPMQDHTDYIYCTKFSPSSELIASASEDATCVVWSVTTRSVVKKLELSAAAVCCVAWSADSELLIAGDGDGHIFLLATANWEKVATLSGHTDGVAALSFFPNSRTLCSGSDDKSLRLWSIDSFTQQGAPFEAHTADVVCVAVSHDETMIASGGFDSMLVLWDVTSRKPKFPLFAGHAMEVSGVMFSPDDTILVSSCYDGFARFWSTRHGIALGQVVNVCSRGVASFALCRDGMTVASGGADHTVKLWHFAQSKELARLPVNSPVTSLVWERDGLYADGSACPIFRSLWHRRRFVFHVREFATGKAREACAIWNVMQNVALFISA